MVYYCTYSKTCVKRPLSKRPKIGFQDQLSLKCRSKVLQNAPVEHSAILLQWSILHYFRSSLSYHLSLRSLFYLFLSGRFTQVLLYESETGKHFQFKMYFSPGRLILSWQTLQTLIMPQNFISVSRNAE